MKERILMVAISWEGPKWILLGVSVLQNWCQSGLAHDLLQVIWLRDWVYPPRNISLASLKWAPHLERVQRPWIGNRLNQIGWKGKKMRKASMCQPSSWLLVLISLKGMVILYENGLHYYTVVAFFSFKCFYFHGFYILEASRWNFYIILSRSYV